MTGGAGGMGTRARLDAPSAPESFAPDRSLLDEAPVLVLLLDEDGRTVYANRLLCDETGYVPEAHDASDAFEALLPERHQRLARRVFRTALAGREPRAVVLPLVARDGHVLEIRWRGTRVGNAGAGRPGVLVVGEDVTASRLDDAKLRLTQFAVDRAADSAFWMTADGRFFYVNDAACRTLGYRREELLGMAVYDIDPEFTEERWAEHWSQLRRRGSLTIESRQRHKSGREVPVEITGNFVRFGRREYNCAFARDITERKEALQALRASEERFRSVVDAMREAMIAVGEDGHIAFFSRAAEEMFGYEAADVVNGSLDPIMPPEFRGRHREFVQAYFAGGKPGRAFGRMLELPGRHRDGRTFPMEISLSEARIGERRFVIGVARDVTARKEAVEALRESEEQLELALRGSGLGLWDWNVQTGMIRHNERWAEMLGYSLDEIDPTFDSWESMVHPDDYGRVVTRLQDHLEGRTPVYEGEYRLRGKHGDWIWVHDRGRVVERDPAGKPLRAAGTHLDITERKRTEGELAKMEALLRAAVEQTPAGILVADAPDVRIRLANPAALGIRGTTEAALTDIPVSVHPESWQTFHPDGTPYAPEELPLSRAVLEGQTTRNEEVMIRRQDGEERWVLANASPVHDADGKVAAGVVVFPDITERKRASAEQRALEAKVQEAQKFESLGVLAGGIAHDFNNLLTSVLGHADLALGKCDVESKFKGHLQGIATAATRAADLCRQLLAYSGRGRFVISDLDLPETIREMGHLLEVSVAKGVGIEYCFGSDVPAVRADVTQLRQVVMNLLTNASEAIGQDGGCVRIQTSVVELQASDVAPLARNEAMTIGPNVCLEVSDDGCGMDDATLQRVFDPFFTTKFTGRGLGLAAVLGIVRSHGGGIDVRSALGEGTTFRVFLPATSAEAASPPPVEVTDPTWRGEGTILVVDDEAPVRKVLTLFLQDAGFSVLEAEDGVQALEVFEKWTDSVKAVVLDLTMPHMDGVETFRALQALRADLPVLLTSGYTEEELATRFGTDAPAGFVQKPFRSADLLACLRRVLALGETPSGGVADPTA